MRYLALVGSTGAQPPEALEEMGRGWPAYEAEMESRAVRAFGRELDMAVVTVRVREGRTLVTDGPFAETKEQLAGMDLLECADLDEAIEVEGKSPVARFCPFEIRPLPEAFRVSSRAAAFGRSEDGGRTPYILSAWVETASAVAAGVQASAEICAGWRDRVDAAGTLILGGDLAPPDAAVTVRLRDGRVQPIAGPFLENGDYVCALEVISCETLQQAVDLAAGHPLAETLTLEVRPFYTGSAG